MLVGLCCGQESPCRSDFRKEFFHAYREPYCTLSCSTPHRHGLALQSFHNRLSSQIVRRERPIEFFEAQRAGVLVVYLGDRRVQAVPRVLCSFFVHRGMLLVWLDDKLARVLRHRDWELGTTWGK